MTILGVPDGNGFIIGTSKSIAAPSGGAANKMDMSLDDVIKSRRSSTKLMRNATTADRLAGKGKAKRSAAANARRGITQTAQPTTQEIEREVFRQANRVNSSTKKAIQEKQRDGTGPSRGRKPRSVAELRVKARRERVAKHPVRQQDNAIPPTWIGGTRRPPSKKAVTAAVEAMQQSGFKVPKGMQMVISFAPAPNQDPTPVSDFKNNNNKKPTNAANRPPPKNNPRGSNNNNNNNMSKGGGRGRGGGMGRRSSS